MEARTSGRSKKKKYLAFAIKVFTGVVNNVLEKDSQN